MTRLTIHGAGGKMGRRLVALATEDPRFTVTGAVEFAGHEAQGTDVGRLAGGEDIGVPLAAAITAGSDVVIDFSLPAGTRRAMEACRKNRTAMVIGTTGLQSDDHAAIDAAADEIAVLQAPNMSLGVNLMFALAAQAAARLGDDYDIEIVESHHRYKKDAPSGTALGIAEAICGATGKSLESDVIHGRHGDDVPRQAGQIGMHALRLGDLAGRHTASFATPGEELQLTHIATTRDVFAHGALTAAAWLSGRPAGRYRMADVLGL